MFVIAKGRGAVIAAIAYGSLLAAEYLTERHFHDDTYYQTHAWPKLAAFATAALVVRLLTPDSPDEHAYLPASDRPRSLLRPEDSLFFIPAGYWPPILLLLGLLFYLFQ